MATRKIREITVVFDDAGNLQEASVRTFITTADGFRVPRDWEDITDNIPANVSMAMENALPLVESWLNADDPI
jgi:hypothetical protein